MLLRNKNCEKVEYWQNNKKQNWFRVLQKEILGIYCFISKTIRLPKKKIFEFFFFFECKKCKKG